MSESRSLQEMAERGEESRYEIQRSLGRIEGQLTSINSSFMQHITDDASNFKEIKLNISVLQKKLFTYSGILIALGFFLTHSERLLNFIK